MKFYADTNRSFRQFQIGDMVYLKLQPFAQTSVAHRSCAKLTFKYFGPFKIVDKTGSTAYKLLLPELAVIHPVFHVSQLKQHIPNFAPVFTELPPAAFSEVVPPNPESILDHRLVRKGAITQVLIKWTGLPTEMSSWEDYNVIKTMFSHSSIWGPAGSSGGGTAGSSGVGTAMTMVAPEMEEENGGIGN